MDFLFIGSSKFAYLKFTSLKKNYPVGILTNKCLCKVFDKSNVCANFFNILQAKSVLSSAVLQQV